MQKVDFFVYRYIQFVRIAKEDTSKHVFITAMMWAEMKKSACYKVDVCLSSSGVISEAQCECGAGQGPSAHCKHVGAVLFGLSSFKEKGEFTTALTCTQVIHLLSFFRLTEIVIMQIFVQFYIP